MSASERQMKILRILHRRKHETIDNLAKELGVCKRTIIRDIEELSVDEPIYTQAGRYYGGVYIDTTYSMSKMYFEESDRLLIGKIIADTENNTYCTLNEDELKQLKRLLADYSKPKNKEEIWTQKKKSSF